MQLFFLFRDKKFCMYLPKNIWTGRLHDLTEVRKVRVFKCFVFTHSCLNEYHRICFFKTIPELQVRERVQFFWIMIHTYIFISLHNLSRGRKDNWGWIHITHMATVGPHLRSINKIIFQSILMVFKHRSFSRHKIVIFLIVIHSCI